MIKTIVLDLTVGPMKKNTCTEKIDKPGLIKGFRFTLPKSSLNLGIRVYVDGARVIPSTIGRSCECDTYKNDEGQNNQSHGHELVESYPQYGALGTTDVDINCEVEKEITLEVLNGDCNGTFLVEAIAFVEEKEDIDIELQNKPTKKNYKSVTLSEDTLTSIKELAEIRFGTNEIVSIEGMVSLFVKEAKERGKFNVEIESKKFEQKLKERNEMNDYIKSLMEQVIKNPENEALFKILELLNGVAMNNKLD